MRLNQGAENEEARKDGFSRKFPFLITLFFEIKKAGQQNDRRNDNHDIEHGFIIEDRLGRRPYVKAEGRHGGRPCAVFRNFEGFYFGK